MSKFISLLVDNIFKYDVYVLSVYFLAIFEYFIHV